MKNKGLWILGALVLGVLLVGLYILGTQYLWNWLIPEIFNGPVITFKQTAGLILLVCMFGWMAFGSKGGHGHNRHHWKSKWKSKWNNEWCKMSDEERASWKKKFEDEN